LTLEFERVLSHSEHLIELDQQDRVMKHNKQSHEAQPDSTMVLCHPTHGRKSCMRDREVLPLATTPMSFLLRGQYSLHRFSCPFLHKSQDEISFKGEGCNTPCYGCPNYHHCCLNHASNPLVNQVLIKLKEILFVFTSNRQSKSRNS
jgi:hypothetical protein